MLQNAFAEIELNCVHTLMKLVIVGEQPQATKHYHEAAKLNITPMLSVAWV